MKALSVLVQAPDSLNSHRSKKLLLLLFILCTFQLFATEFTLPKVTTPPVIDGKLERSEWQNSLSISGAAFKLDPRLCTAYLSYDNNFLYIALKSELPLRGSLLASPDPRRNPVSDDSLELWFLPPAEQRSLESGKFGYFQLIVNSLGKLFTRHHDPGYGLPAKEWQMDLQQAHRCEDGFWTAELAFPAEAFGIPKFDKDGQWKILLVRNYQSQPAFQAPLTKVNGFMNTSSYSNFNFSTKNTVAVQQVYSSKEERRLPSLLRFYNSGNNEEKLLLEAKVGEKGDQRTVQHEVKVAAKSTTGLDLDSLFPNKEVPFLIKVIDSENSILWERENRYSPPPEKIWFNMEAAARLEQSFDQAFPAIDYSSIPDIKLLASDASQISSVPGRSKEKQALYLKDSSLTFEKLKIPVPGSVSLWVKTDSRPQKTYRRYFSSKFVSSGYIFCQENNGMLNIGAHHFPDQRHKNLLLKRVPAAGEWTHIVLNLFPGRFEAWINGIKRGELDHGVEINSEKLGDLMLGNSSERDFAVSDLAVYERILSDEEIKSLAQGESAITGNISWYQAINSIVLDLSADLSENSDTERFSLQIRNEKEELLKSFPISFKEGFETMENNRILKRIHQKIPLETKLPDGEYIFYLLENNAESPLIEKKFAVKDYPWLGNQLGLSRRLLPPFTALQRKGKKVSCLLRDYTISNQGLIQQVNAAGENILNNEIKFIIENNGKQEKIRSSRIKYLFEDDINIRYQTKLRSPSIEIDLQGEFEFDGLLKLDLYFSNNGNKKAPDRVYIDIPVKAEFAKLFHACGEGLRMNPGGFVPEGTGKIWGSRTIAQTNISNFIPYIWLGEDERGICYGADWDQGWAHTPDRDAVELHRNSDGSVSIRLNLLNNPEKLQKDIPLTLAFMASPVKKQPEGWRGWSDSFMSKGTKFSRCFYSNPYWGSYSSWTSRYPAFEDFGYIEKLMETVETGVIDQEYVKNWIDRIMNSEPHEAPIAHRNGREYVRRHTLAAFHLCKGLHKNKDKAIVYPYTCNITGANSLLEFPVFRDEWDGSVHVYKSYSDYAIYYLNKMFDCGFGGVYDDNVFLAGKFHWATGNGWIDDKGNIRPSLGLWRVRDYHKRQLTLMVERGMDPWLTVHHTNTNNLIALGFATNSMGMEWKYGAHDFQERFSADYVRAVCHGKQGGFFPTVLDGITGANTDEIKTKATRTMLAVLLPHEVRPTCPRSSDTKLIRETLNQFFDFGTHEEDSVFYPYWKENNPVLLSSDKLLSAAYLRGKEMLIFIGSYLKEDAESKLSFTFKNVNPGKLTKVVNLETEEELKIVNEEAKIKIPGHDFIFLKVQFE